MNKKIEQHLKNYCTNKGWNFDATNKEDVLEVLIGNGVARYEISQEKYFDEFFRVAEIDGMFIGFVYPYMQDEEATPEDVDYVFDVKSIIELISVKKMVEITTYTPVKPLTEKLSKQLKGVLQ